MDSNSHDTVTPWVDRAVRASMSSHDEWQPDIPRAFGLFQARRRAHRVRALRWASAGFAGSLVVILVTSFSGTRALAARCVEACVGLTARVGQLLQTDDAAPRDAAGLVIADHRPNAPAFTMSEQEGRSVRLTNLRGRVVLLNFWATWCKPCTLEMPWLADFHTRYNDQGLTVIGASLDEEGWAAVRPFVAAHPVPYVLTIGTNAISDSYGGINALPASFLIDRHGRVASRHLGLVPRGEFDDAIRELLAETPPTSD